MAAEEYSDVDGDLGLLIDCTDESDQVVESIGTVNLDLPTRLSSTGRIQESACITPPEDSKATDLRTGLVWEASPQHCAPDNSTLQRERPKRIASILQALDCKGLRKRCVKVDSAEVALGNDDYLRVHRAGYLQRYVY